MRHEQAFKEWVLQQGFTWEHLPYARPEAGGETDAYLLAPARPPHALVVFAHGAGNDALFPQINLFRALLLAGYAVWTFDLDGHGRRSTTRFDPAVIPGAISDALAHARAACPGLPVHLLSQSFGGALALGALAHGMLPGIRSAVLLSAPLHVRPTGRTVAFEVAGFCTPLCLAQRRDYGLWGLIPAFGRFKRAAYPIRLARTPGGSWDYVRMVNETIKEMGLPESARRMEVPTLLIYGTRDWIVPLSQGETLRDRLPGAELLVLPGATHYTTAFSPDTEKAMLAWFAQHQADSRDAVPASVSA